MLFLGILWLFGHVLAGPVVEVLQGKMEGVIKMTVRDSKPFSVFSGIPYAQPPVGDLRFQRPLPPLPWNETLNATKEGPKCMQSVGRPETEESEDCLFLNIQTPRINFSESGANMPVVVFFHGGGYTIGSGTLKMYGADYFMHEDLVLVTLNYRLGSFGFLSFLTKELPGNMGLWDQVAALNWVKNNIAKFGGDPANVTIAGESAGGSSVHAHILSDSAEGLFTKGISESGNMMCPWAMNLDPVKRATKLAEMVGCSRPDVMSIVNCLKEVSRDALIKSSFGVLGPDDFEHLEVFPFVTTMDANITGIKPFFPDWPEVLMKEGKFQKIPYINGINSNEMLIALVDQKGMFPEGNKGSDFSSKVLEIVNGIVTSEGFPAISQMNDLLKFGRKERGIILNSIALIIQSMSNVTFRFPTVRVNQLQSEHHADQFLYEFDFEGALDVIKQSLYEPVGELRGVPHAQELFYMFYAVNKSTTSLPDTDPAMVTLHRMVRMWSNFAKYGHPTPVRDDPLIRTVWPTYSNEKKEYMAIKDELTVRCDLTVTGECTASTSTVELTSEQTTEEEEEYEEKGDEAVHRVFGKLWLFIAALIVSCSIYFLTKYRYICFRYNLVRPVLHKYSSTQH